MSWVTDALKSSVGKKCVMGLTGLFLCFFLVVHLAGNLLLYAGAEKYDAYAHALHNNPALLIVAEVFLYAAFITHIYLAFVTNRENHEARGNPYAMKQSKRADRVVNIFGWAPDTTMFVTGAVILGFLIIHLNDFSWTLFGGEALIGKEPFEKAVYLMRDPVRAAIYLVGSLFLGVHVAHGLQSAFQSLGVNHPRFRVPLRRTSIVFGFIIAIGFASFSAWGLSNPAPGPVEPMDPAGNIRDPADDAAAEREANPDTAPEEPPRLEQR